MFDKIRKMFINERKKTYIGGDGHQYAGRGYNPTLSFYKGKSYDNAYPSISRITNEFMTIRPYAIDANGKPLNKAPLLDALYHPNKQMSSASFREALAVMALVHKKVYILVHHYENNQVVAGGPVTPTNIAGFTFLEGVVETTINGVKTYRVGAKTYTTDDVLELYSGIDPYDVTKGYSPTTAAAKWANLDDYIATYQTGLFENGAVPAGQFIITAPNVAAFDDIVDEMQRRHRGSGRNNNVIYTHRPISETTGNPTEAQIEWIPFAQTNKDLKLSEIFEQANKKLDSVYGVPASIRGVNDNNTYASVRVDEQIFIKYTVIPFATKIWTQFTHEMNRLTGGLGYAITFEADVPGVADEEKIKAEKKLTELTLIREATMLGYSLDSIVDAFELSNSYKLLEYGDVPPHIVNDKPEVDEGDEVSAAPDPAGDKNKKADPAAKQNGSGVGHVCNSDCKHSHKMTPPKSPKVVKDFTKVLRDYNQNKINAVLKTVNSKKKDTDELDYDELGLNSDSDEEVKSLTNDLLKVAVAYMLVRGAKVYKDGQKMLKKNDVSIENTNEYTVDDLTTAKYQAYLTNVAKSYDAGVAQKIRSILAEAQANQWDKETLKDQLRGVMNTEEWRVQRLARTEEHRIFGRAGVDAMTQLMNETGTTIYKVWHTNSGDPCEFCQAMDGHIEVVDRPFVPLNGSVEGKNGGKFINNFVDVEAGDLHPNCGCQVKFAIEKDDYENLL